MHTAPKTHNLYDICIDLDMCGVCSWGFADIHSCTVRLTLSHLPTQAVGYSTCSHWSSSTRLHCHFRSARGTLGCTHGVRVPDINLTDMTI